MSNPKKLYRDTKNQKLLGVCAGLAEYFNLDVNIVRIATIVAGCMGWGIIAYIVAAIILPTKTD